VTTQNLILLAALLGLWSLGASALAWKKHRQLGVLRKHAATLEQARKQDHVMLQEARRQIEQLKARPRSNEAGPAARPSPPRFEPVAPIPPAPVRQSKGFLFFSAEEPKADFKDTQILDGFDATRLDDR
jgi:hypothetical protein